MGWTAFERDTTKTVRQTLEEELTGQSGKYTILASATKMRTFYAAVRTNETGEVWGLVVLLSYGRPRHSDFNFAYKEMSEEMGPGEDDCPARILDLLTPTDNQDANAWRQRCRAKLAKPQPQDGQWVRFERPIKFTNGYEASLLRFRRNGRRSFWTTPELPGITFKIGNLKDQAYEVVEGVR